MKCQSCSAEVPAAAKFCPECGAKIVRKSFCPECGAEAAPGAKFCAECGTKLAASSAPAKTASAKPSAKKRAGKRPTEDAPGKPSNGKAAAKEKRTASRENAALAARPDPKTRPYEPAEPDHRYAKAQGNFIPNVGPVYIRDQVLRIVNAEGPITEGLLLVRVLDEWGFPGPNEQRLRVFKMSIPNVLPRTDRLGEPVYWPVGEGLGEWNCYRVPGSSPSSRRCFKQIPLEEIAAAIVAEHHASSGDRPIDDYVPGALERLGLSRDVSPDMGEALEVAKRLAQGIDDRPSANTSVPDEWNEAAAKAEEAERRKKEAERRKKEEERRKKEAERRRKEAEENEKREKAAVSFWAARLAEHPEEAELFDSWSELSPEDWILLLSKQPRFARRCRWGELPEHAVNRIVALRPELRRYKPRDVTFEGEKGEEITIHYDDAAAERGIEALGSASFWNAFAAQQNSESDDNGGDPPPPED